MGTLPKKQMATCVSGTGILTRGRGGPENLKILQMSDVQFPETMTKSHRKKEYLFGITTSMGKKLSNHLDSADKVNAVSLGP